MLGRKTVKSTYRVLALLVQVVVALQAAFIAAALFGIGHWVDDGHALSKTVLESGNGGFGGAAGIMLHGVGATVVSIVAIVLLVVAFFAHIEGGVRWATLILADVIVQWGLAAAGTSSPAVGGLHGINAFVMFGLGMMAATAARRSMAATKGQSSAASTGHAR
jgi:hypothetical protein